MRYIQSQMKKLVKDNKELQMRLRELMDEHELEKGFIPFRSSGRRKVPISLPSTRLTEGVILIFQRFMAMNHGRRGDRVVRVSNPN